MANDLDGARQDLAFLRGLAEDSRPMLRPLGAALVIAGLVHASSALRIWAVGQGWIAWPAALRPFMGVDGLVVQVLLMVVAARVWPGAMRLPHVGSSPAGRAVRGAINALAWALGAAAVALFIAGRRTGEAEVLGAGLPVVLFAMASGTWWVVSAVYRRYWARGAAVASAVFAAVVALASGGPAGALAIAAGLIVCVAAPGLAMMRQSREA